MKRDLAALADRQFDVVVIGGGIVGACLARDASRRGLAVALVEADDFAGAASEAMSHFVHGGIRYLAQGRLTTVLESLRERAVWRRIAPHLVADQPFLLALSTRQSRRKRAELQVGVSIFEILAGLGIGRRLSRRETIDAEPVLDDPALLGGLIYHDCRVDFPERAVLALLADAVDEGAAVANHAAAHCLLRKGSMVEGIEVEDRIGGGRLAIRARAIINAAGPWAGIVADRLAPGQRSVRVTLSKGIHFVTAPLARTHALAYSGDGDHAVLSPWRGFSLVGTTDEPFAGDPRGVAAEGPEREKLADKVRRFFPGAANGIDEPIGSFAAVRAIPGGPGDTYAAARDTLFTDHASDGAAGLFTLTGGKWTTARLMAEKALDAIVARMDLVARPCDTATTALRNAPSATFRAEWMRRLVRFPSAEAGAWLDCYGSGIGEVAARIAAGDDGNAEARDAARFAEASENEMAITADDLVRRLTRAHALARPDLREHARRWLANRGKGEQA